MQAEPEVLGSWVAEEERLAVLQRSRLLDLPPEPELDRWTAALCRETGAAVAEYLIDRSDLPTRAAPPAHQAATRLREHVASHNRLHELIAQAAPLSDVLSELVAGIEHYEPSVIPCVVLLDRKTNTLHPGAGPSLPPHYLASIDGVVIGPNIGTCGSEAWSGQLTITEDIAELDWLGMRIVLDDFGTGYSSLSSLKHHPLDGIKIDRSFINGLRGDVADGAVVTAVVGIAGALGCPVTAEGVETQAQLEAICGLQCERAQGFLLARPASADDLAVLLRSA